MSAPALRVFPDPILRQKAQRVKVFGPTLTKTIDLLDHIMRSQSHGIGIAAPQIGILKRIAIVDVSKRVEGAARLVLINPMIVQTWEARPSREGCMSLPDYTAMIKRYDQVLVRWTNEAGEMTEKKCQGIEAVCVQHEVDHLDGILYLDHVQSLKRDMIPRESRPKKRS